MASRTSQWGLPWGSASRASASRAAAVELHHPEGSPGSSRLLPSAANPPAAPAPVRRTRRAEPRAAPISASGLVGSRAHRSAPRLRLPARGLEVSTDPGPPAQVADAQPLSIPAPRLSGPPDGGRAREDACTDESGDDDGQPAPHGRSWGDRLGSRPRRCAVPLQVQTGSAQRNPLPTPTRDGGDRAGRVTAVAAAASGWRLPSESCACPDAGGLGRSQARRGGRSVTGVVARPRPTFTATGLYRRAGRSRVCRPAHPSRAPPPADIPSGLIFTGRKLDSGGGRHFRRLNRIKFLQTFPLDSGGKY